MRFKRAYLEITNLCNLQCPFCRKTARAPKVMSLAEFRLAAEQIRPYCEYLYLHVKGEPLTHPQLAQILEICAELKFQVNLTTNATLIAARKELLMNSPVLRQTNLSVHGYTEKTHGDLRKWLEELADYANGCSAAGKFTVFRMWNLNRSRETTHDGAEALAILAEQFPQGGNLIERAKSERSITLGKGIFLSFEEEFIWPSLENEDLGADGICYGGRTMVGILADGTVVPCCLDGEGECAMGNLFEVPFSEIISSPRFSRLSESFTNRHVVEPLCRKCGYRLRFTR
jgi:radical SAM protein with 4Fe4S-binding SPASM domain